MTIKELADCGLGCKAQHFALANRHNTILKRNSYRNFIVMFLIEAVGWTGHVWLSEAHPNISDSITTQNLITNNSMKIYRVFLIDGVRW
ncbi:MAG: hypothetical protein V4732_02120 [Pseudomonadota bacterium]